MASLHPHGSWQTHSQPQCCSPTSWLMITPTNYKLEVNHYYSIDSQQSNFPASRCFQEPLKKNCSWFRFFSFFPLFFTLKNPHQTRGKERKGQKKSVQEAHGPSLLSLSQAVWAPQWSATTPSGKHSLHGSHLPAFVTDTYSIKWGCRKQPG